jgi:exosortase
MALKQPTPVQTLNPIAVVGLVVVFIFTFFPVIRNLVEKWIQSEDHSHGLLIIPVCCYSLWRNRDHLKNLDIGFGGAGGLLVTLSMLLYLFSYFAGISTISYLSLVVTIWAVVWSLLGKEIFKAVLFPMVLMLLMIPVPAQLYSMATIPLQFFVSKSSAIIVGLLDVPILREGNVLHMPERTLEVVQACSGLRSLMSLVTLCAIFGHFTLSSNLLRTLLIISSVPIAIIVNIIRVVMMILAFHFTDFDLSKGTLHTAFGIVVFLLALVFVAILNGIFSKWDIKRTVV